jgi:hypothetical protein
MKRIQVTYTRTRFEKPLVVLDGGPFNGVEYTPEQLRAQAVQLLWIANTAADRPCTGKRWTQSVVSYPLAEELQ